jgi:predicted ATPase
MMSETEVAISRIELENFKSIRRAQLDLSPLTILVGENSAGKSSVLQAIFLLAQVARGRARADVVSLNGLELNLGNFTDVVHASSPADTITFRITLPASGGMARRRIAGNRFRGSTRPRVPLLRPEEALGDATWSLVLGHPGDQLGVAAIEAVELSDRPNSLSLSVVPNDEPTQANELYEHSRRIGLIRGLEIGRMGFVREEPGPTRFKGRMSSERNHSFSGVGDEDYPAVGMENGFPLELYALVNESHALSERWLEFAVRRTRREIPSWRSRTPRDLRRQRRTSGLRELDPALIAEQLFPAFQRWVSAFDRAESMPSPLETEPLPEDLFEAVAGIEDDVTLALADLLETTRPDRGAIAPAGSPLSDIAGAFRNVLYNSVHYLGPLREDPSPSYRPGQSGGVATLGIKGEYTVAALDMYRNQKTLCPLPEGDSKVASIGEALDIWAGRFDFARQVLTHDKGRSGIELELIDPQTGDSRDLTNVGVGVSQLLPVLLLCLLAQPGDLILLEQPELHLHPAPQQILGDFLIGVAATGRQLLVETHSEYLVNRLRLRIAEDEFGSVAESVRIWYAHRVEGQTGFDALQPNRYGSFEKWPEGFFDQAPLEAERILRAAARKRRAQPISEGPPPSQDVPIHVEYQGRRVEATFDRLTEQVVVLSEPFNGKTFRSPSGAAVEVVRRLNPSVHPNRNGWGFWVVTETGELLQSLRRT